MLLELDMRGKSNWVLNIPQCLNELGMGFVLVQQGIGTEKFYMRGSTKVDKLQVAGDGIVIFS